MRVLHHTHGLTPSVPPTGSLRQYHRETPHQVPDAAGARPPEGIKIGTVGGIKDAFGEISEAIFRAGGNRALVVVPNEEVEAAMRDKLGSNWTKVSIVIDPTLLHTESPSADAITGSTVDPASK